MKTFNELTQKYFEVEVKLYNVKTNKAYEEITVELDKLKEQVLKINPDFDLNEFTRIEREKLDTIKYKKKLDAIKPITYYRVNLHGTYDRDSYIVESKNFGDIDEAKLWGSEVIEDLNKVTHYITIDTMELKLEDAHLRIAYV